MPTEGLAISGQLAALNQIQTKLIDLGFEFGPRLFVAALILAIGYYVGRWVGRLLDKVLVRLDLDVTIRQLLIRTTRLLVLVLFLILALQNLGVDLLPLIAGLGVAGAGIALAMQGVLSNLAAGLTIVFTRPYRVGEYISIVNEEGLVESISLFSTTLSHPDLSRVVIPNRMIAGEILHNYGEIRQLSLAVGVAYDTDIGRALALVEEVLCANPRVLREPKPLVQVATLADFSVSIAVRPWVNVPDFAETIGELNRSVLETFRVNGISIPVPQREIRLLGTGSQLPPA
ncbi:MAG: mechanosensitive ion channel family protein [Deltaproteobacteria bacterium]|nr:MAG: mechanosensitive ion channel family protein [Deltaproteobacteria bacterium]